MIEKPDFQKILISPSLLSADFTKLGEEVAALERGGADWLHFDVMDGRFVPNLSIGIPILERLRKVTRLPIDVHLMIVEPDSLIDAFAKAGADTLCVQIEACTHLHRTISHIHQVGCRAGVALNPHTPLDGLKYVIDDLDFVLLMSVNPGFGGQRYIPSVTRKIAELRAMYPELAIEVDGGIKASTIGEAAQAGANIFVSGTGVFSASDYGAAISELRTLAAH